VPLSWVPPGAAGFCGITVASGIFMAKQRQLTQQTKGKPWTVKTVHPSRLRGRWGECRFDTREIILTTDAEKKGVDRQVFLHELIHKVCPWMDEDAVDHLATEQDDALDVMGM